MLIIDGAFPMASSAIMQDRDLLLPLDEARNAPRSVRTLEAGPADTEILATLPEMRKAGMAVAVAKIVQRRYWPGYSFYGYRTDEITYAMCQGQLAYYRILEAKGEARIIRTASDLRQHMYQWENAADRSRLPVGLIVAMEGADGILWPEQVREYWDAGMRAASLVHTGRTHYSHGYLHAHGDGHSGGLFPPGRDLLKLMDELGMVLDLSHHSDQAMWEAMDVFEGPVMATHHMCRALFPNMRALPDDLLGAIVRRDGVVGLMMSANQMYLEEKHGPIEGKAKRPVITLEDFADHVDHVCGIAGDSRHVAIGADTDGQGGRAGAPREIDSVVDYHKLVPVLERRGYSAEDVANVMYRNWQRFFEAALPE